MAPEAGHCSGFGRLASCQPSIDLATIKQRQQATWACGDLAVVGTTLQIVGEQLAEAAVEVQRCREWQHFESAEAKSLFEEVPEAERAGHIARFEEKRLGDLASPIAKAWRRDGVKRRIAASSFHRW